MKTILLLNPPGKHRYLRDNFCGTSSKANYIWQPIDLLVQTGILGEFFKVKVIDAIAEGIGIDETFTRIINLHPDAILTLSSIISLEEDSKFLSRIKNHLSCQILVSGDVYRFNTIEAIKMPFIDGILMDYTSSDTIDFFQGKLNTITDIVYKDKKGKIINKYYPKTGKKFSYPGPKHSLLSQRKYHMPFIRYHPFATVITSIGCPFCCSFCMFNTMGYRERELKNIFEELDFLHSQGFKEIYFKDATFSANKERAKLICKKMIEKHYRFSWFCDNRIDCCDFEMLQLMKAAGCHTIMFGVESGEDEILKQYNKGITTNDAKRVISYCRKIGIMTLAHIIIGYPKDTHQSIQKTIRFVNSCGCDYLSVNIFVPRFGSQVGDKLFSDKREIKTGMDTSIKNESVCVLSTEVLMKYKRKAMQSFYLNPLRLLRLLFSIRTIHQIYEMIQNAKSIMINN